MYLELRYLLSEGGDEGRYNAVQYERDVYLSNQQYHFNASDDDIHLHGPAAVQVQLDPLLLSSDHVPCVRCLSWPSQ